MDHETKITVTFEFEKNELYKVLLNLPGDFTLPSYREGILPSVAFTEAVEKLKQPQIIKSKFHNSILISADLTSDWYSPNRVVVSGYSNRKEIIIRNDSFYNEYQMPGNSIQRVLTEHFRNRIYLLKAERYNTGRAHIQNTNDILDSNCSNLAHVLHSLHTSTPYRFKRIVDLLKTVFPHIKDVTAPIQSANAQIEIWSVDPQTERKDLAVPLTESGTGIGQVLAILYLIIYSDTPQVILIDEPQSFLHPGAIRSLMEILNANNRHQYIITTHSPYLLSYSNASVIQISLEDSVSKATQFDSPTAESNRLVLKEIGFKLSDVFGADHILWVEGPTEEECFKLIVRKLIPDTLYTTEILGVRSTGKLEGKDAEDAYDIYTKLSKGFGVIPPAIGFILDKEKRTPQQMEDLSTKSGHKVHFLPRMMYENYLLYPKAIAKLLNEETNSNDYSEAQIKEWIDNNGNHTNYIQIQNIKPFSTEWTNHVHAAKLLNGLFNNQTQTTVSYQKVRYGVRLTKLILDENPDAFAEIIEIISRITQPQ